jgi:poly-gamma-glutamate synthesis protein (capsule biosynthesis protein)
MRPHFFPGHGAGGALRQRLAGAWSRLRRIAAPCPALTGSALWLQGPRNLAHASTTLLAEASRSLLAVSCGHRLAQWPLLAMQAGMRPPTTLFLCGDVMTGHGIDQLLPRDAGDEFALRTVQSALEYVRDAEASRTPLPRPVSFEYPWGDALHLLKRERPDLRLINLATTITTRGAPDCTMGSNGLPRMKPLHARMHPLHLPTLAAIGVDGAVLANHHVLDWGHDGLHDTLQSLRAAGIGCVGAGHDCREAAEEGRWLIPGKARVRLFAFGHASSGVPEHWAADTGRPGINWLQALDDSAVAVLAARIRETREEGDIVVVSLHWGSCWGYAVPEEQRRFAHALIDEAGVDLVWGHASHHPRPIEVYRGRLILYGVGDFMKDTAGTPCHEAYRPELAALYLPRLAADGSLQELRLWPMRVHLFRLKRACGSETQWLAHTLSRECRCHGTGLAPQGDGSLRLYWH